MGCLIVSIYCQLLSTLNGWKYFNFPIIYANRFCLQCKLKSLRRLSIGNIDKNCILFIFVIKFDGKTMFIHAVMSELCPLRIYVEEWTQGTGAVAVATNRGYQLRWLSLPSRSKPQLPECYRGASPAYEPLVIPVSVLVMIKMWAKIRFGSLFQGFLRIDKYSFV